MADTAPSATASAQVSGRTSRTGSRPRANSPLASDPTRRKRPVNDARLRPMAPDVMSNLIDSFNSISQISDDQIIEDPVLSSSHTSQKASRASSRRRDIEPAQPPWPDPTTEFAEYKYPSRDIVVEPTAPEDAAEPPTVRTSRRPSANTQNPLKPFRQQPKTSIDRPRSSHAAPAPIVQPPSRLAPPSAWNYRAPSEQTSPSSERTSIDTAKDRTRRNSFKFFSRTSKSSSRATSGASTPQIEVVEVHTAVRQGLPTSPAALRSPSQPNSQATSPPASPPAIPRAAPPPPPESAPEDEFDERIDIRPFAAKPIYRQPLPRARIEEDTGGAPIPEPSSYQKRYSSQQVFQRILSPPKTPTRTENDTSSRANPFRLDEVDESAPSDIAVTQDQDRSPLQLSSRSVAEQAENSRPSSKGKETFTVAPGTIEDDEIDALKRVRELKAAKEERRKSLHGQSAPDLSAELAVPKIAPDETISVSPLRMNPPATTIAAKQVEAKQHIDERTIINTDRASPNLAQSAFVPQAKASPPMPNGILKDTQAGAKSLTAAAIANQSRTSNDLGRTKSLAQSRSFPKSQPLISIPNSPSRQSSTRAKNSARPSHDIEARESIDEINRSVAQFLGAARLSQHMYLHDEERNVAFSEVGDPNGFVVFCCVGMGLTRYITAFYDELATSLNLRLITLDRPGIGQSTPYVDGYKPPLSWPDDVRAICMQLKIRRFSLLAHSAGAIYALATALRMPQHIHGTIHLLAPWIPPSQMSNDSMPSKPRPTGSLPKTQRLLRMLPTSLFKLGNKSFLSSGPFSSKNKADKNAAKAFSQSVSPRPSTSPGPNSALGGRPHNGAYTEPSSPPHISVANFSSISVPNAYRRENSPPPIPVRSPQRASQETARSPVLNQSPFVSAADRQRTFDSVLTPRIWSLATANANPSVDLLVCLERNAPIGFRYADIGRQVVIHHGSKDARVPLENVKWLAKTMRKAEVRVLEGEGHGLMARAGVMAGVLGEVGAEWAATPPGKN